MASRQSSAAPEAATTRAERTNSMPSMLVKARATFLVLSPSRSLSSQHNRTRKRSSTGSAGPRQRFPKASVTRSGHRRQLLKKPIPHATRAAADVATRAVANVTRIHFAALEARFPTAATTDENQLPRRRRHPTSWARQRRSIREFTAEWPAARTSVRQPPRARRCPTRSRARQVTSRIRHPARERRSARRRSRRTRWFAPRDRQASTP